MATVTGTLLDVGLGALTDRSPLIEWVPSQATTTLDGQLLSGVPVQTTPAADGSFTVELYASELTSPPINYSIRIRLLDPSGNFTWVDFPDWRLFVPAEGGTLDQISDAPASGTAVWEVAGDTIPAYARRGDLMLNTITSDLYRIG